MCGARNEDSGKIDLKRLIAEMNAAAAKPPPPKEAPAPLPPPAVSPPPPRRGRRWLVLATAGVALVAVALAAGALAAELTGPSRAMPQSPPDAATNAPGPSSALGGWAAVTALIQ